MTPDPNVTAPRAGEPRTEPAAAGTLSFQPDTATGGPPTPHEPGRVRVGEPLGKYTITGTLGQGGMGMVVKGHDPKIERDVAIKVLADYLSADPTSLGRFLAEAKAGGKLNHPNVVAIYEIGQEAETHYLVLEYVPGGSLADRVAQGGALPALEATRALIDACRGVGAAHAAGVVHRDIKPANFMVAADGSVKVTDFGLAKAVADTGRHLTQTGTAVGTPFFMSPEQCEAKPVDHRTDVYSLGATYYSLLTGKYPFHHSATVPQLMYQHCHGPVPDPRADNPAVPEACARIVARAMAKAPADRYQTADEMLVDLQAVAATLSGQTPITLPSESGTHAARTVTYHGVGPQAGTPTQIRSPKKAVAAGLGLVAVIGFGLLMWRPWEAGRGKAGLVAAPAGEPIKVGVLHSLSGTMATSTAPVVDATLFAIDEVNQAGGVLGRPVKPVVADGGSDWPTFGREAERLIDEEKVCTIFGCWSSAGRKAVKDVVEAKDHLLLYPVQYEGLETSSNIVYLGAAPNQQIIPAVEWAVHTLHKKRFFHVGSDYVFPRAASEIIKDQLKKLGAELVDEAFIPVAGSNTEAAVAKIVKAKPDMILNTINGDVNIPFFRDLRAAGVKSETTPTLSFSVSEQGLRSLGAGVLTGDYSAYTYFQSIDTPENREFVQRFKEKYPQRAITDPMETAYLSVKLWAMAVNEAQTLEPRTIRSALKGQRIAGPGGELRFDSDTQHAYRTPRIAQVQPDGQFKVILSAPGPVKPEPFPNTRTAEEWRAFLHDLYTKWGNQWAAPNG
jgi:urea transport system substrate-binding protein